MLDPEDLLRLDDDPDLLLLLELDRDRFTEDPDLDELFDDLTELPERLELLLLFLLIETLPLLFTADSSTADPTLLKN